MEMRSLTSKVFVIYSLGEHRHLRAEVRSNHFMDESGHGHSLVLAFQSGTPFRPETEPFQQNGPRN